MSTEVVMPQMGESIAEGTITKWLKKVGETVERDEPLFEISTDKVDAEIPSPAAGVLTEIKYPEGTTVEINTVVAVLDGGNGAQSAAASAPAATEATPEKTQPAASSSQAAVESEAPPPAAQAPAQPIASAQPIAAPSQPAAQASAQTGAQTSAQASAQPAAQT
ncbi:MAG TPA: biotin/lipoyl-containing protein, partial [Pyrinomonadaceae bacterium]